MGFLRQMFGLERDGASVPADARPVPVRAMSGSVTEISINSSHELEEALRKGFLTGTGQSVNERTALQVATVFACVRIRAGAIANTPLGIKRRIDDRTREDATDNAVWRVINRRPNKWQKPAQFKRMMEAHVLLRGNAYAVKTRGVRGELLSLTPLHPDQVEQRQLEDMSLEFIWTRKDGRKLVFKQDEIFHLCGLTLDGVNGLSVLAYARESIALSLAMEQHGSTVFKNGANVSAAFSLPEGRTLSQEQANALRAQLDEYRSGGARDGKAIVLEDGLKYEQMGLAAKDAEWLDGREFSRTDLCMFFGVPPHLVGITNGNTQLGSSIESQTQSFVTFSLEDSFIMWEEAIGLDLLEWDKNPDLYARYNRNAMVRGDIKTRWDAYVKALQWGVKSPNDVLADEDENPRDGGDIYYPPPNMTANRADGADNGDDDVTA